MKALFLLLTSLFVLLLFHGCETPSRDESSIPWSRPANWEGQAPGMGGMAPGRGR